MGLATFAEGLTSPTGILAVRGPDGGGANGFGR
jgi:hypothetical protein